MPSKRNSRRYKKGYVNDGGHLTKQPSIGQLVNLGELSTTGLRMSNGVMYEEVDENFRGHALISTCTMMSRDSTIYSANNAIKSLIRRVKWRVDTPDARGEKTPQMLKREQFIRECMDDMTHSFGDFINEALSMMTYGFSVHEKVFKLREGLQGKYESKYDDGKIGWARLPIRSQDTITRWKFDEFGHEIKFIEQNLSRTATHGGKTLINRVDIPYNKVLHFTFDCQRGNPEGNTPLKSVYIDWKYKTTIQELEAIGISRDFSGMPYIGLPPEYLSPDASEDKQAVYSYMQDIINNLHMNEQAGLIFPKFVDPETKQDIFEFKLVSPEGSKQFDTGSVIDRYENKILMAYLADVLKMGQDSNSGSFALSDNKTNLMAVGIESILTQILEVINRDLIKQTAIMNGWDISKPLPAIVFEDLDERDLDKLGAFVQRTIQVGAMEVDQVLSDELRQIAKLPKADADKKIRKELLNAANQGEKGADTAGTKGRNTANRVSAGKQSGVSN